IQTSRHSYPEAESSYWRALSIEEKAVGSEHPAVATMLNNLAQIYRFEKRYADAARVYERAIGIWEHSVGNTHPDLARCLLNYSAVLRKIHRKKEAGEVEARARETLAARGTDYTSSALVDWHQLQRR